MNVFLPHGQHSNTTLVKVKYTTIVCNVSFVSIQIQHLLKLNLFILLIFRQRLLNSNTTLVKVKFKNLYIHHDKKSFKYNTC